jgi:hypothetical protein
MGKNFKRVQNILLTNPPPAPLVRLWPALAAQRSSPLFALRPPRTWVSRLTARQVVNSNCRLSVTPASCRGSIQYSVMFIRGNSVTLRTQKVIQGVTTATSGVLARFPWLLPVRVRHVWWKGFPFGRGVFPWGVFVVNHFETLVQKDPPNGETEARTPSTTAPNLPGLCIESGWTERPESTGSKIMFFLSLLFFFGITENARSGFLCFFNLYDKIYVFCSKRIDFRAMVSRVHGLTTWSHDNLSKKFMVSKMQKKCEMQKKCVWAEMYQNDGLPWIYQ